MHAMKIGWVGQSFAVAMSNDSRGKKSRIRRSKDERKAIAESFIKKYQKLNSGNFPSLNLTHKEVGGSFYTVREIVREIIQENRVLGPAKFSTNGQSSDEFLKQFPLGSVSVEPQTHFSSSSDETCFVLDQQGASEELVLISNGQVMEPEHKRFDTGRIINVKQPGENNQINDKLIMLQVSETLEAEDNVEEMEASAAKVVDTTAVVPLEYTKPAAKVSSDETCFVRDHQRGSNEELVINSNGHFTEPEHQSIDDRQMIDENQKGEDYGKVDKLITLHVSETFEAEKNVEEMEASAAEITKTTSDVTVEFTEPAAKVSLEETCFMANHLQVTSEELLINLNRQFTSLEHQSFENGQTINGDQSGEDNEKCDKTSQLSETGEAVKIVEQMEGSVAKVTSITAGVIVETFPLRLATKPTQSMEESAGEVGKFAGTLKENETKNLRIESENGNSVLGVDVEPGNTNPALNMKSSAKHGSSLVDEKAATMPKGPVLETKTGLVDGKSVPNYGNPTLGGLNASTTKEGVINDIHDGEGLVVFPWDGPASNALEKRQAINEITPVNAPNGIDTRTFSTNTTTSSSLEDSIPRMVASENKAEVRGIHHSQIESNPTLDRIDLESWASKKSIRQESNPILAFFKAFIAAFVKFWFE